MFLLFCFLDLNSTDVTLNIPDSQYVGQSLMLKCSVTTVRYITNRLDIIWSQDDVELKRTEGVNVSYISNNKAVYVNTYNIFQVSTSDSGMVYNCKVIINLNIPLIAISTGVLNVTGKRH